MKRLISIFFFLLSGFSAEAGMTYVIGQGSTEKGEFCRLEMDLQTSFENLIQPSQSKIYYIKNDSLRSVMFMSSDRQDDWIAGSVNPLNVRAGTKEARYSANDSWSFGLGSFSFLNGRIRVVQKNLAVQAEVKWVENFRTRLNETCTIRAENLTIK